ncbi:PDZ and LIM domain protein 1 [Lucilia cuprina]|nr:PDZ and LIM domain protein 1 [Lucilia cuprina]
MSPKLHEFAVVLKRDGQNTPWGIRLVGGNDLDTPLIITRVQVGSPAFGEVLRGDIISKIRDYDARDVSHADAQMLFRTAGNEINLVVHRDNKIAYTQGLSGDSSRSESALLSTSPEQYPHRAPSPFLPGPGQYERALQVPVDTLPHTVFPKLNASGGYVPPPENSTFTPMPTRDHQQDVAEEQAAIVNQEFLNHIFIKHTKHKQNKHKNGVRTIQKRFTTLLQGTTRPQRMYSISSKQNF